MGLPALIGLAAIGWIFASSPVFAQDAVWEESPQLFFANELPSGTHTYAERDVLVRIPTRYLHAVRLLTDSSVEIGGARHQFRAGDVLPQVQFRPDGTEESTEIIFCTPRHHGANDMRSPAVRRLFGEQSQVCLQDTDGDGMMDTSLVVGSGQNDFTRGGAIVPVATELADDTAISDRDGVQLEVNMVGTQGADFKLQIERQGRRLPFDTVTSGAFAAQEHNLIMFQGDQPVNAQILSIMFQIVGFDAVASNVTVHWVEVQKQIRVRIPDEYVRTTIYRPF